MTNDARWIALTLVACLLFWTLCYGAWLYALAH